MEEQISTSSLQAKVNELETKQTELLAVIETKENEFGKKRAQFKEIFLQKETDLEKEVASLKISNEENTRLLAELHNVSSESDNLKTAMLITETSNSDDFEAMQFKYQEEITSLKAIMQDAVQETREEMFEKSEEDRLKLVIANQELEAKLAKYKAKLRELKAKQQPQDDGIDSLFDVPTGTRKNTSLSEDTSEKRDENLENSMKKAQEHAEALRSIVMPLEEEIAALKSKLWNANEKISAFEVREKKQVKNDQTRERSQNNTSEEMEEKVKELSQYLEAERSSRTDLEMFVAVLNTQKGVLQEDADKLRKELHNVCRLLEQEKEEHVALKDTWEMANDRFLETQRVQRIEIEKIKKRLTVEQHKLLDEDMKNNKEAVELLAPPLPATKRKFLNRKTQKQPGSKKEIIKTRKVTAADAKRTLSNLVRGPRSNNRSSSPSSILDSDIPALDLDASPLLPSVNTIPCTVGGNSQQKNIVQNDTLEPEVSHHIKALSDGEGNSQVNESSMRKYKSADDLKTEVTPDPTTSLRRRSAELDHLTNENFLNVDNLSDRGRRVKERIDWKSFEEAAKSSLSNDVDRSCAMCTNYEKQLQKLQGKNEELSEETAFLAKLLKDEQGSVVVIKREYERLEQSVKLASEDAQAQINASAETQRNLEGLLEEINVDIDNTKKETAKQVIELVVSKNNIQAQFEQLSKNYNALQSTSIKQIEQSEDSELKGVQEKLHIYEAASKTKEAKLQSEIDFMKDRVLAEQVAKESMEEMYSSEIESLGKEIKILKMELGIEKQRSIQLEQHSQGTASKEVIAILEKQLQQLSKDKTELEKQLRELKSQLHSLNGQLNNSESVQRDFVKLSQSLQMELEEMKESQKEIKLEHEETDVNACRKCKKQLNVPQDKHYCSQCRKIFCSTCSNKTVNSPQSHEPLRVCVDCYDVITSDTKVAALADDRGLDRQDNTNINKPHDET